MTCLTNSTDPIPDGSAANYLSESELPAAQRGANLEASASGMDLPSRHLLKHSEQPYGGHHHSTRQRGLGGRFHR